MSDRDIIRGSAPRNRGTEIARELGDPKDYSVTLLTIDTAILAHLANHISPVADRDGSLISVPIIYGDPPKWSAVQKDGALRDSKGRVQTPIIMVHRTGMKKDEFRDNPVNKYMSQTFDAGWNRRTAYDKFAAQTGITPSQAQYQVTVPDYIIVTYEIVVWAEFISQLNTIVEQINFEDNEFWGDSVGPKFKVILQEYVDTTESPSNEDRIVKSTFSMDVHAYLLPERMNAGDGSAPTTEKSFTVKKVITFTESTIKID